MVVLIALFVIMFGILGFRIYRTIHYYNEAHNSPDREVKRVARTNFIIHLVFCIVLSLIIAAAIYWFVLAGTGDV